MTRQARFLVLCLLLVVSTVCQGAFKFTAWADNRPSLGATTQANFHWVVLEMNRILCDPFPQAQWPAFHIVPGDYDYTSQTEDELSANSDFPTWYYAPGNHDDNIGSTPNYTLDYPDPPNAEARFIFVNEYICPAGVDDCSAGRICSHILSWIENQLVDAPPVVFVVGHEPAYPQNRHVGDSLDFFPTERDDFWNLLNLHNVYAYLCGHTHYYSTYSTGPTVQIDLGNAGNPGDPEQTFAVFEVADGSVNWQVYQGLRNQPFDGGAPASNPSPGDGAVNVGVNPLLSWTAGTGAQSHNVYLSTSQASLGLAGTLLYSGSNSSCTASGLTYGVPYYWRVDEVSASDTVPGPVWTFTTKEALTVRYATAQTTIDGSVTGGLSDIQERDNLYEQFTEVLSAPNKNAYSVLEHVWQFDNVPAGANLQLRVEAHHSASSDGDNFMLSYSTDQTNFLSVLTVTKTRDDNGEQIYYGLPAGLQGTIWIKLEDTDHTRKNQLLDTAYVDCLYLVSSDEPIPAEVVPNTAPSAGGSMHVADLDAVATAKGGSSQWTMVVTVKIVDADGSAVSGATVTGAKSG